VGDLFELAQFSHSEHLACSPATDHRSLRCCILEASKKLRRRSKQSRRREAEENREGREHCVSQAMHVRRVGGSGATRLLTQARTKQADWSMCLVSIISVNNTRRPRRTHVDKAFDMSMASIQQIRARTCQATVLALFNSPGAASVCNLRKGDRLILALGKARPTVDATFEASTLATGLRSVCRLSYAIRVELFRDSSTGGNSRSLPRAPFEGR